MTIIQITFLKPKRIPMFSYPRRKFKTPLKNAPIPLKSSICPWWEVCRNCCTITSEQQQKNNTLCILLTSVYAYLQSCFIIHIMCSLPVVMLMNTSTLSKRYRIVKRIAYLAMCLLWVLHVECLRYLAREDLPLPTGYQGVTAISNMITFLKIPVTKHQ